jgi:hypothetical protein
MYSNNELNELRAFRQQLVAERVQTAGHGRRARIQQQIDDVDAAIARELRLIEKLN